MRRRFRRWIPLALAAALAGAAPSGGQPRAPALEDVVLAVEPIQKKPKSNRYDPIETGFVNWFVSAVDEVQPPVPFRVLGQTEDVAGVVHRRALEEEQGAEAREVRPVTAQYLVRSAYEFKALDDFDTITVWMSLVDMETSEVLASADDHFSIHGFSSLVRPVKELIRSFCEKKRLGKATYDHQVAVTRFGYSAPELEKLYGESVARSLEARLAKLDRLQIHKTELVSEEELDPKSVPADLFVVGFFEARESEGAVWVHITLQIIDSRRKAVINLDLEVEGRFESWKVPIQVAKEVLKELEPEWNKFAGADEVSSG